MKKGVPPLLYSSWGRHTKELRIQPPSCPRGLAPLAELKHRISAWVASVPGGTSTTVFFKLRGVVHATHCLCSPQAHFLLLVLCFCSSLNSHESSQVLKVVKLIASATSATPARSSRPFTADSAPVHLHFNKLCSGSPTKQNRNAPGVPPQAGPL